MNDTTEHMTKDSRAPMTEDELRFVRDHSFQTQSALADDWRAFLGPNYPSALEGALDAWAIALCKIMSHEEAAKTLEYKANVLRLLSHKKKGESH